MVGGLALAALVYAPVAALDWRTQEADRYIDVTTERAAANLARAASRRVAASAADRAAINDMKTWGFEANNIAIAQVLLEQRLSETATAAGLTNVKITPHTDVEVIGPNQWLGADIQADLRWASTFRFLDALTAWPEGFRMTQFRYEISTPSAYMPPGYVQPQQIAASGRLQISIAVPVTVLAPEPVR